jgi:hypothetical protein
MQIHMLVAHRNERYTGEYGPEVCVAWDEYCIEENREGYDAEVAAYKAKYPTSTQHGNYARYAEIAVEVDADAVMDALYPENKLIEGKVSPA